MIRGKKILGALLAFTLCFGMVIPAQADDISDAKKKQQELEQQKNTAEAEKSELSSELDSIVSKMEKTQSDLTAKETEINDAETELVTAKANEDDQYQTMKLRIKYMYENGSNEFLEILMEANSIADLLNKAEYINKISKCDRELLVEYEDTRKDVENRENALKKEYAELENLQDELAGEQANVEVQFYKYGIPGDSIAINFEIGGEMMPADTKGTVIMRKGKATIPVGTMKKPGFRDCRLTTTVDGKKYSHHVKVGFSPEKLRPYTTMPADFQQFWENEKVELAKFPLTYTKEHVKKYSTDQIDCYLIKLQVNQRGQSIYGYLFYPKKEGKYPVCLLYTSPSPRDRTRSRMPSSA